MLMQVVFKWSADVRVGWRLLDSNQVGTTGEVLRTDQMLKSVIFFLVVAYICLEQKTINSFMDCTNWPTSSGISPFCHMFLVYSGFLVVILLIGKYGNTGDIMNNLVNPLGLNDHPDADRDVLYLVQNSVLRSGKNPDTSRYCAFFSTWIGKKHLLKNYSSSPLKSTKI